ncbi:MAG: type II secretion system F family protein, partial [Gammaproteobacteria bacterium]|nr:type II secretion system F family protein [Gammaproteobacteria bacterium]
SALFSLHHRPLPWITSVILNCAQQYKKIYGIILLIIASIFLILKYGVEYNFFSIKIYEAFINKTPVIGKIVKTTNQIHFCFSMFILLKSGIPIHSAFKESIDHVTLPYSKQQLHAALNDIMHGKPVSQSLKNTRFLPYFAIQTINSAENTGQLDDAFHTLYEQLSDELNQCSDRAGKTIEPFIIILLGGMIGMIVIAIYLPIFQLGSLY